MSEETGSRAEDNQIISQRKAKLTALRARGNPFPNDFRRQHTAAELHAAYGEKSKEMLLETAQPTAIAGRIVLRRGQGKASFLTIQDMTGRMQAEDAVVERVRANVRRREHGMHGTRAYGRPKR